MIVEIPKERALELIEKVATFFASKRLGAPAILFLESVRPLNFIGSQIMYMVVPFANVLFSGNEFEEFAALMQDRDSVELMIKRIDELDEQYNQEARARERLKRLKFWNKVKSIFRFKKNKDSGGKL